MGVFDSVRRIQRPGAKLSEDRNLPNSASLSWGRVTDSGALAGTTGDDCELVHEDRWQQLNGFHTEKITGNHRLTVHGDQTVVIHGKHNETIVGHCYQNIIGPHVITNHEVLNETRMARCTLVYGSFFVNDNPTPEGGGGGGRMFWADYYLSASILNHEIDTTKVEYHTAHGEAAVLMHAEAKGLHGEWGLLNFQKALDKVEVDPASKEEVAGLKEEITAMNSVVSATNTDLTVLNQKINAVDQQIGVLRTTAEIYVNYVPEFGTFVLAP